MKKELFEIVLNLSKQTGNVSWEIEKFMEILLKETNINLNQLHEDLMFFCKLFINCNNENERWKIAQARYLYLKNIYGVYFERLE